MNNEFLINRLIVLANEIDGGNIELQRGLYDKLIDYLLEYPHSWELVGTSSSPRDVRLSLEYQRVRFSVQCCFFNKVMIRIWEVGSCETKTIIFERGEVFSKDAIKYLKSIICNVANYCKSSGNKDLLIGAIEFFNSCCYGKSLSTLDFEIGELLTHENHIVRKVAKLIEEKCREYYENTIENDDDNIIKQGEI